MSQINLKKTTTPSPSHPGKVGIFTDINGVIKTIDENGTIQEMGGEGHLQNTDIMLAEETGDQVTAEELRDHLDSSPVYIPSETAPNVDSYKEGDIWVKLSRGKAYQLYDTGTHKVWYQPATSRPLPPEWVEWFESVYKRFIDYNSTELITIDESSYTVQQLVDNDYPDILVKYDNTAPHNIRMYGLLKPDLVGNLTQQQLDTLHLEFELWEYWSGVLNSNGVAKDNRPAVPS